MERQEGFTLIEVIIAMALLAVGILAVASMQISSLEGNSTAERLTEASTWAGDLVEQVVSKGYNDDDLKDGAGAGAGVAGLDYTDETGKPADGSDVSGDYTLFWNVADDYPITGCKTIRVIVRRSDLGTTKEVKMDYIKMGSI